MADDNGDDNGAGNNDGTPPPAPVNQQQQQPSYTPPATQADLDRILGQRLNQERAKFGGLTGDQVAELRDKAAKFDKSELEKGTDIQRAVTEAKTGAEQAADARYRPMLAETAFRVAIGSRKTAAEVDDFIGDLNLARFLTDDGKVDTAKVLARVEQFAPSTGTPQAPPPKGPVIPAHNPGGSGASALKGLTGEQLFDRLHPKKTA